MTKPQKIAVSSLVSGSAIAAVSGYAFSRGLEASIKETIIEEEGLTILKTSAQGWDIKLHAYQKLKKILKVWNNDVPVL